MFKPAKMSRIRLIIHKKYFERIISALQDIGVMQIEALPERPMSLLSPGESADYKMISDYAQRFRGLESLLYPKGSEKKFSFENIEALISTANGVEIDARVSQIRKELDEINANIKDVESKLALLQKINDLHTDLSIFNTKNIVSFVVYGQELKLFEDAISKSSNEILKTQLQNATIFSVRKNNEKTFSTAAEKLRISIEVMPKMSGRVSANKKELDGALAFMLESKNSLEGELLSISESYYPTVSALREQFDIEMEKVEIVNKLGMTGSIVVIEGWVPDDSVKSLETLVSEVTDKRFVMERIKTKEHPPTKLQNPVSARLYEFFVKFYSIPKSDEIDPTIMFALAFPIFFGFMVGDFGYGLVMLLLAFWIIHRVNHPPKVSRLPKALTSFVTMIVSPDALRVLAKSIIPGAIIAMILGILFNNYFGFQLPYATPFNVEQNLGHLLVIAGWVGVFMVEFGFFLGFLNKWAEGEKRHAIGKIGWMLAGAGMVILGLNVLHQASLGFDNISSVASYILLIIGIIMMVVFEGARGLMELPSLISHMLSYTRLVGILLASVILAEVTDLIFIGGWHHSIILGLIGTVILIVGQLFNLTIAMFEPGIQGARLIYVEFFSKFFDGNGRAFKPFTTQRNRTLSKFKL
jgi:V/A-type H+/Na+-transporting ATPase subunit I